MRVQGKGLAEKREVELFLEQLRREMSKKAK